MADMAPTVSDDLIAWLRASGAFVHDSVYIRSSTQPQGGRGLFLHPTQSTPSIRPSHAVPVIRIPSRLLLSPSSALSSSPHTMTTLLALLPPSERDPASLILFVLRELHRGAASPWRPFLASLPDAGSIRGSHPLLWSDARLEEELVGTPLLPMARGVREELREVYETVVRGAACVQFVGEFGEAVEWETFVWVHAVVESRTFKVQVGKGARGDADADTEVEVKTRTLMVPLVDMTNHPATREEEKEEVGKDFDEDAQEFYVTARVDVGQPREVFLRYGNFANWQFLLHFGFAVRDNPHESLDVMLEYPPDDPTDPYALELKKLLLLEVRSDLVGLAQSLSLHDARTPLRLSSTPLWRTLRLLLATEDELADVSAPAFDTWLAVSRSRNDAACEEVLSRILQAMLRGFTAPHGTEAEHAWSDHVANYREGQADILRAALQTMSAMTHGNEA